MSLEAWQRTELQQLQSKIVLLEVLNDTPSQPAEKDLSEVNQETGNSPRRVLTLSREKELTENLAFIASTTDDPGKVLALAVEEREDGSGMSITLAVNNGRLENVTAGFEKMAKILQRISETGVADQSPHADLLREIITLNHNRILCRLRSRHATSKCCFKKDKMNRPKPIPMLVTAFEELSVEAQARIGSEELNTLRDNVLKLHLAFRHLEDLEKNKAIGHQGLVILSGLVTTSSGLSSLCGWPAILDYCQLQPSSRPFIANMVTKLGRYCTAARFLHQAASRFSIFAQIRISVIKLSAMPLNTIQDPEATLTTILSSLFSTDDEILHATSQLKIRQAKMRGGPSQLCTSITSTKFVVHAEIQLLVHYELQNSSLPPRIICSSKKACFLCNLFLELHGKFIVPSTHGKLYEKWTLPKKLKSLSGTKASSMFSVLQTFSGTIDERLKSEILVADKPFPAPAESIAFNSAIWSEVQDPSLTPTQDIDSGYDGGEKESMISSSSTIKSVIRFRPESSYVMLTRGQAMIFELSPDTRLVKVGTPRIHLTFTYAAWKENFISLSDAKSRDSELGCQLRFSYYEKSESPNPGSTLFNLAKYLGDFQETFGQLAGSCDFYVVKGEDVISIQTTYL